MRRQIIRITCNLSQVYIGPQETCVHEAKMAAAFDLPMISYVIQIEFLLVTSMVDGNIEFFNI